MDALLVETAKYLPEQAIMISMVPHESLAVTVRVRRNAFLTVPIGSGRRRTDVYYHLRKYIVTCF